MKYGEAFNRLRFVLGAVVACTPLAFCGLAAEAHAAAAHPARRHAHAGHARHHAPSRHHAHQRRTKLRVVVKALPAHAAANVTITGPHHLRRRVAHTQTLELPRGAYVVHAAPVRGRKGRYFPTKRRLRLELRHRGAKATISYRTLVPKRTKSVPAHSTVSISGKPSGTRTLVLSGAAAHSAHVGEILASGPTTAAPDGYLVEVTKVLSGGRLQVRNATLLEALPSGEIDTEASLAPPSEAASASSLSRLAPLRGLTPLRSNTLHRRTARAADYTVETKNLTCTTSAGVHIERPTVKFKPSLAIHARWGLFKLDYASFTASVQATLSMGASAEAGASCETKGDGIGLLAHPISLPTIDIQVGVVPIVITPKLQIYLSGNASISGKVSLGIEQSAGATVGAKYEKGHFSPIVSFPSHFTQSFTTEADAEAELALRPTLQTLIYGVAGPTFDIGAAAKFDAEVHKTPWWTLEGCLQAGVGFVVPLLDIDWSDPHLLDACKPILSASSGPPAPPPAPAPTPPAPSTPPAATPLVFESAPGTGPPPPTLGGYAMQTFPADPTELGTEVSSVAGPTGAITFASPLIHERVEEGWQTWSNGYLGDVYETPEALAGLGGGGILESLEEGVEATEGESGAPEEAEAGEAAPEAPEATGPPAETTITLPHGTGAFYLYAEPDEFVEYAITATAQDGTSSGPVSVEGEAGARYFGFYAHCGSEVTTIHVVDTAGDPSLAVGEFGIAPVASGC